MRSEYLGVAERDALQEEVERHGRRLAEVEALAKAEGWGAVHPILRRR